jgi:hypothetical protein
MTTIIHKLTQPFARTQTYLNLAYLVVNIAFGFTYFLILTICLALAWGLVYPNILLLASLDWASRFKVAAVILAGILVIPAMIWVLQLFVVPEQWLARLLLKEKFTLDQKIWSKDSYLFKPGQLFVAVSTWKRLSYMLLKIPLGAISFFALFIVLLPALALFGMPLAYLTGFQDLIIGPWRFDSIEKAVLAFLAGILLLPLSLYAMNMLAKLSGWMARALLTNAKMR